MKRITGLIGRDALVADVVREIRKGKHVLLTGPVGVGKSAVLRAAIWQIERREEEHRQLEPLSEGSPAARTVVSPERRKQRLLAVVYLHEHQAKGQFVTMARRLLQTGIVKPSALGLAKGLDSEPLEAIAWASVKRTVNR
jgi:energy-coupling factor transporter ATP-binding protein EcfA2